MNKKIKLILGLLILMDLIIWFQIILSWKFKNLELYFLNVGQGDSELIISDGVKILIDGGPPNNQILKELAKILPITDRFIDLIVATHPQFDHYGGLIDILRNYQVGAVITNGRRTDAAAYQNLINQIKIRNLPYITLKEGDAVKYRQMSINVLGPSREDLFSYDLNDTSLVFLLEKNGIKALYVADIDSETEEKITDKYDLRAQILKVAHHGSKYSSHQDFLKEAHPKISIIEVGKNNYGHPAKIVLDRLTQINSQIFRTDKDGTVKIIFDEERLKIYNNL